MVLLAISACTVPSATPTATVQLIPTQTPPPPTATSAPMAMKVNGEGVWLEEYQASLSQLTKASQEEGLNYTNEQMRQMVLDDLIAQTLLAQQAYRDGFTLDQAVLDSRINDLASKMGGMDKLDAWRMDNGYSPQGFRQALSKSMAVAYETSVLANKVGTAAEQVHARQIRVSTEQTANYVIAQLAGGVDFATLAYQYDPLTGGDLGWFPRGYLTQPVIEEAAFALQVGEYSGVIKTELGYHIVYVIERDAAHPLSDDARNVLQHLALENWVKEQRTAAVIEILVP